MSETRVTTQDIKDATVAVGDLAFDPATQAELDAHTSDTTAAHAASAVSADSTTLVGTGTDVQAVLEELDNGIADHLADTTAAHAASAVSADSTTLVGTNTDVQGVLEELDNGIADHLADTTAAHAASAISADSTTLVGTGTDVQAVFEELDDGIAASVPKSLYDANTVLAADSDNTPAAVTVAEQTLLGRITAGNIVALSVSQIKTLLAYVKGDVGLGSVDNTSDANKPVSTAQATADALAVPKTLFDANTVLAANVDDTPAAVTVAEQTVLGRITGGNIVALTVSQIKTLLALVKGDVGLGNVDNTSDANKPVSTAQATADALAVPKSLYDANSVLAADTDDTPAALTMGASTILARLAAGNIKAATPAELRTLLALVIGTNVQAYDADLDAVSGTNTGDQTVPAFATPAVVLGSSAATGAASTVIRSDGTIAAFDATAPTTSSPGDAAAVGTAAFAARRDHVHAREDLSSQSNTVQATDETLLANYGVVIVDEYVMDATHELIFSDPSEMAVI